MQRSTEYKRTFLGVDHVSDTAKVTTRYGFIGIPFGPPYEAQDLLVASNAADAVREITHTNAYAMNWHHYDFDTGKILFENDSPTVTDCGNVPTDVRNVDAVWDEAVQLIRPLIQNNVVPLVVGGLDSIPPMVVEAFAGLNEEFNVLHVDAHLDFRDEVDGVKRGYSSPIRRIREYPHVTDITQIGLRSIGSGRPQDVQDALAAGNNLLPIWQFRELGVEKFIDSMNKDKRWIITIDCDGLDPTIAPGVGWPEPNGITFQEIGSILRSLAKENLIAGLIFTELRPELDVRGITAQTVARLVMNVIGLQQ